MKTEDILKHATQGNWYAEFPKFHKDAPATSFAISSDEKRRPLCCIGCSQTPLTVTVIDPEFVKGFSDKELKQDFFTSEELEANAHLIVTAANEYRHFVELEKAARKRIFSKAGVSLENGVNGWVADISSVTAETLDAARKEVNEWDAGQNERRDRVNANMRRNERAYRNSRRW